MKMSTARVRKKARIEIIPLIDIIFFLLATFILVSMAMVKNLGMLVQLPGAATATKMETVNVAVSVNAEGQIYFNKEAVDLAGLEERVKMAKGNNIELAVELQGDKNARYEMVLGVFDKLRRFGVKQVSIKTSPVERVWEPGAAK